MPLQAAVCWHEPAPSGALQVLPRLRPRRSLGSSALSKGAGAANVRVQRLSARASFVMILNMMCLLLWRLLRKLAPRSAPLLGNRHLK